MFAELSTEGVVGVIAVVATPLGGIIALLVRQTITYRERMTRLEIEKNKADAELEKQRLATATERQRAASDQRHQDEEGQIDRWKELYNLVLDQLTTLTRHSEGQDALIDELVRADSNCQIELERLYGITLLMHSNLTHVCTVLRKHDNDCHFEPMPMPERPKRRSAMASMEFRQKQVAQDSVTLANITDRLRSASLPGNSE